MSTTRWRLLCSTLLHGFPARLAMYALAATLAWDASAAEVLALVPDVREPYRSVLYQIVEGIRETADTRVAQVPAAPDGSAGAASIGDERVLIALGNGAVQSAVAASPRQPIVAGAVVSPTGDPPLPGISLESDPNALFRQLIKLRPGIRRVHWLYRPQRSGWLLDRASADARGLKLELVAHAVENARDATLGYQEILRAADSATEALWLSQDPALVSDDATLPVILDLAWTNNVMVFSGSLQHVAKGVLFALYPDNSAMGADLARMAIAHANGKTARFEPNRGLRRALNWRTARHLGLPVSAADYDLVLPAR
jgi:putative ABC transport system substrate-binding protein